MNILTNNCIGGFIYRDILHEQYKNPFIWTRCHSNAMFVNFIAEYDSIDFRNVTLESDNGQCTGHQSIVIDHTYKWYNNHILFSINDHTPRYDTDDYGNNVYIDKPWAYIIQKYFSRLGRMETERKRCVVAYDLNKSDSTRLYQVATIKKIPTLIFSSEFTDENQFVKTILYTHPGARWEIPIIQKYGSDIKRFIDESL